MPLELLVAVIVVLVCVALLLGVSMGRASAYAEAAAHMRDETAPSPAFGEALRRAEQSEKRDPRSCFTGRGRCARCGFGRWLDVELAECDCSCHARPLAERNRTYRVDHDAINRTR